MPRNTQSGGSCAGHMRRKLRQIVSPEGKLGGQGQDLIEYALMVGFVAVAVAAFIPYSVTGPISSIFTKIGNFLTAHANG